jgi:hypothetical protein
MNTQGIFYIQLYDYTETTNKSFDCIFETQAQFLTKESPSTETSPEGLHHRAVHAVRKTRMQMRQGTGPRAEVFFICQLSRRDTPQTGIHSQSVPGTGRIMCGRLSSVARNYRGDMQYQPGAAASERTFVRGHPASGTHIIHGVYRPSCRRESGRHHCRQHARKVAHPKIRGSRFTGGE